MSVPYKATTIANYFLKMGMREDIPISPMKLQKLIYFAHGWCLAICNEALIVESVEAWKYGPVIDSVYYKFQMFGSNPIRSANFRKDSSLDLLESDTFTVSLLKKIWDVYKNYNAFELSEMTHLPKTPWKEARRGELDKKFNVTIDDDLIREYFIDHVKQRREITKRFN